jgi:hypothetical protein
LPTAPGCNALAALRPLSLPTRGKAQLPQWLYAVWHFLKKMPWLPETTRHRLSASLTRSESFFKEKTLASNGILKSFSGKSFAQRNFCLKIYSRAEYSLDHKQETKFLAETWFLKNLFF